MRNFKYIEWYKEAEVVKCTTDEFKEYYYWFKENGTRAKSRTEWNEWRDILPAFSVAKKNGYKQLFTCDGDMNFRIYTTAQDDPTKDGCAGTKAIQALIDAVCEDCGTKDRRILARNFGTIKKEVKKCIPKQFFYINKNLCGPNSDYWYASSVDDSSHYPAALCGELPTSKDCVELEGRVEPTEEYPFAFYIKSGHLCIHNGVDTRKWTKSYFMKDLFNPKVHNPYLKAEDDKTILMKRSDYRLDKTMDKFYSNKKNATDEKKRKEAKLVLNALIGMFHQKSYTSYKYAHLAAVCLARANQSMLDMCETVGVGNVLHVAIDGCIYLGDEEYGCEESDKGLGRFVQEFTGCEVKIAATNKYMAMKDGVLIKFKHGGCNYYKDGRLIDDNPPKCFDDMNDWIKWDPLEECV